MHGLYSYNLALLSFLLYSISTSTSTSTSISTKKSGLTLADRIVSINYVLFHGVLFYGVLFHGDLLHYISETEKYDRKGSRKQHPKEDSQEMGKTRRVV